MPHSDLPDHAIVLRFAREGQKWSQAELADAAGVTPNLIHDYERGKKNLTRSRLEYLFGLLGLPPERIDATLDCLAENRAASRPPGEPVDAFAGRRRKVEELATRASGLTKRFVRALVTLVTDETDALSARQEAERLWARLERRQPAQRRLLVEQGREFQTWALCERVVTESIAQAPNHPKEALELGGLALHIADRIPGEQTWRWRMQGLCWAMITNARRVLGELRIADDTMARATKLWEDGAPGDSGLLNEAWLPWIEANLRRDQRRFPLALKKIEEALALDDGELRGKILISKSLILKFLGDPDGSTAVLEQAIPLIDTTRESRLAFGLSFNLLEDLCELGRATEVEPRLPGVRRLAESLAEPLDLTKVVWLEGKTAAGLERTAEALAAFEQARREFRSRDFYLLYALVSLDMALLLLEQGRTAEVRKLAEEMVFIFRAQGLDREALVALGFFCDAAKQDAVTVELIRRVIRFLRLAELDPELKFKEEEEAEAP